MGNSLYRDYSYKKLPIRYVTPLEVVAMALKAGEKKWQKAIELGEARLDPGVNAVYMGCEIRVCMPLDFKHIQAERPDDGWMLDAGISPERPKWLHRAKMLLQADPESDLVLERIRQHEALNEAERQGLDIAQL